MLKVEANWINYWFLRIFAKPVVVIDDVPHFIEWGKFNTVTIQPGDVRVGVGVSYSGKNFLGSLNPMEEAHLVFRDGQIRKFIAQNGITNHSPFLLYEVD